MVALEVTVLGPGGAAVQLELDGGVPVQTLLPRLASAFDLDRSRALSVRTEGGRVLSDQATLSSARVAAGHRLLLVQEARPRRFPSFRKAAERPGQYTGPSGYRVLPCYLAIDTSSSMRGEPITDINVELPHLIARMRREVLLAEICQIGIITFDEDADARVELADVTAVEPPVLSARVPRTNYAAAFTLLRQKIASDLYNLYVSGRRPYRPAVFFLSDGQPNKDDWHTPLTQLTDRSEFYGAPNVVAFGFGDADEATVRQVGTRGAYMPADGVPSAKLDEFMSFLLSSLTNSIGGTDHASKDDIFTLPVEAPRGWRPIRLQGS